MAFNMQTSIKIKKIKLQKRSNLALKELHMLYIARLATEDDQVNARDLNLDFW